jgi:hypothetical protein
MRKVKQVIVGFVVTLRFMDPVSAFIFLNEILQSGKNFRVQKFTF